MLGINRRQSLKQALQDLRQRLPASLLAALIAAILAFGTGCSRSAPEVAGSTTGFKLQRSRLVEVSPPFTIQTLKQSFDANQPQVEILGVKSGQVLDKTQVELKLRVKDLDLYKDADLGLGPYLQVLLDSQPYAQIFDASQPLALENLAPGTHTVRAFAAYPWHESFKNDGAFAQTTFHVFTKTPENNPDANLPLLTYNSPQGTYGAEPVLLDFMLTNAPLHLMAREDSKDDIPDWQLRCTINGDSFSFDRWEPIYLKGLKPGVNWVQLELISDKGEPLPNAFNNAVQLVTYEPSGTDTLALLTRGELTADAARKIVDPNYLPPIPRPEPAEPVAEPVEPEQAVTPVKPAEPEPVEPGIEAILEPDLTQELTPESIPPEVTAPGQFEPIQPKPAPPAPEAASEAAKTQPEAVQEKMTPILPPAEPAPASDLAPVTAPELDAELQPLPESSAASLDRFVSLSREAAKPAPNKPDMISALDRVKGFFEGLRKQPSEEQAPLFSPPKPEFNLPSVAPEDATIIDTLMESLPDSLRRPLMEPIETPSASPASLD